MSDILLTPESADKIAILGSAPSTVLLAPFDNPEWGIWGCSPGLFAQAAAKRFDAWFELHRWMPYAPGQIGAPGTRPWFSPEYTAFLQSLKCPVFFTEAQPLIPGAQLFPYKALIEKYGAYHFTSTIAWMLAFAIETKPKAIGLFGIDMAAGSEWAYQRPGCQHFIGMAKAMGIDIHLPPESDLMRHSTLYGIGEHNQRHVKLSARKAELEAQKQNCQVQIANASAALQQTEGALTMLNYMLEVWTDDLDPSVEDAFSYAGQYTRPALPQKGSTGAEVVQIDKGNAA